MLAITRLAQTTTHTQKARSAQSEARLYLLPKTQLGKQSANAPPEPPSAQLSFDKTGIKSRPSTSQVNKAAAVPPEILTSDKNIESTQADGTAPNDSKQLKRYFSATEVDQLALPIDDWNFSLSHLNPALTYTLQLEIYIGFDGSVDDWVVIKQEPQGDWVEQVVEKLKLTVLMPATKDGLPVNMVRTIEIFIKP